MPVSKLVSRIFVVLTIACSLSIAGRALASTYTDIVDQALQHHGSLPDLPFDLPDPFHVDVPDYQEIVDRIMQNHPSPPDLPFDLPDPPHIDFPDCADFPRHFPDPIHVDVPGVRVDIRFDDIDLCGPNPVSIDWGDETLHVSSSFFDVFVDLPAPHDGFVWPPSSHEAVVAESVAEHDTHLTMSQDLASFPDIAAGSVAEHGTYLTMSQDLASFPVGEAAPFEAGGGLQQLNDSAVPEPTSLVMWSGLGIMGLFVARRRRKRSA